MQNKVLKLVLCGALLLAGCSKEPAGPTATVTLRDGTNVTGVVTKTDTSGITLIPAGGQAQTYPTSQVDSISYVSASGATGSTDAGTTTSTTSTPPPPPPPAAGSPAPSAPAPAPLAEPTRSIAAGTRIQVRNSDRIKAGVAETGQTFPAVIVGDVIGTDGGVAIRNGADATLIVRASNGQGKLQGRSEIAIDLASVRVRGRRYNLDTRDIVEMGKQGLGKNRRSAKFIGGGAALGAIIGGVAGGGAGAAIGGAAGAGGGLALQGLTRGKAVSIPAESVLNFSLEQPVQIRLVN